jgi:hypothetical protein
VKKVALADEPASSIKDTSPALIKAKAESLRTDCFSRVLIVHIWLSFGSISRLENVNVEKPRYGQIMAISRPD